MPRFRHAKRRQRKKFLLEEAPARKKDGVLSFLLALDMFIVSTLFSP